MVSLRQHGFLVLHVTTALSPLNRLYVGILLVLCQVDSSGFDFEQTTSGLFYVEFG